jgi:hypothetical protein
MSDNITPDLAAIIRKLEQRMLAGEFTPAEWAQAVLGLVRWANTHLKGTTAPDLSTRWRVIKGGKE